MREIYLDHAATTYLDERVRKEMEKYFSKEFGNPGSMHSIGLRARAAVDNARETVRKTIGAERQEEVIFTGSGTESINLAIKGTAMALKGKGRHIITSTIEHHAVLDSCEYLEKQGFETTRVGVDGEGIIKINELESAIRDDTILISVMYANNEIGAIQPIRGIAEIAKRKGIIFHTDACQAGGSLDINVKNLGVDMLTLNGSKIYGPKGTGMLYVKKGTPIIPIIHGGGQEFGLRSGTENVPGIIGFAKALELSQKESKKENKRLIGLRDYLIRKLLKIPKTRLNGHPEKRLPNNVNVSFMDIEGEAILLKLNELGICASTGSACTSHSLEPSHVITSLGLPYEAAHGSIRFSLGKRNTKKDIDFAAKAMPKIVEELRELSPVELEEESADKGGKRA